MEFCLTNFSGLSQHRTYRVRHNLSAAPCTGRNNSIRPLVRPNLLKRNEPYFHVDYATKIESFNPLNTKFQNTEIINVLGACYAQFELLYYNTKFQKTEIINVLGAGLSQFE